MPGGISNSYLVTAGPTTTPITFAGMLNCSSTFSSFSLFPTTSSFNVDKSTLTVSKRSSGGRI